MTIVVCAKCGYRVEGAEPKQCGRCGHTEWQRLLDLNYNDKWFLRSLRIDPDR